VSCGSTFTGTNLPLDYLVTPGMGAILLLERGPALALIERHQLKLMLFEYGVKGGQKVSGQTFALII